METRGLSAERLVLIKRQLTTDVCIIGCGPAGITIANELIKSGIRTLIIESGGMSADSFAQGLLKGSASGPVIKGYPNYLSISRVAGVLGSASQWGGYCTPLTPIDFQRRDWVPRSGWPFSARTLAPFAARAASTLGISSFESAHDMLPASSRDAIGKLASHPYFYPQKLHGLRDHLLALAGHPCFHLELGTTAVDIGVRDDQVQWLRAVSPDDRECYVEAKAFVLAAGGIENARILLLNSAAIPANEDVLGRYFQEHFHVLAGKARIPNARKWREYLRIAPAPLLGHRMLRTLILREEVQRCQRLLNASIEISAKTLDPRDIQAAIDSDSSIECDIFVRAENAPNPESKVTLGEDLDPLGRRRAELRWQTTAQDWDSLVTSVLAVVAEIEREWCIETAVMIDRDWPWPWAPLPPQARSWWSTWGNHHMGTTRMAVDPRRGVVDSNCRLHGMSNVFVAGSSVFPTSGFANPTFTIIALSIRLADHIASILHGGHAPSEAGERSR